MLWTGIVVGFVGLRKNERIKITAFLEQKFIRRFYGDT
jgi:hypothetical protein